MMNDVINELNDSFEKTIQGLKKELSKIRTGRASIAMLDDVRVSYYGNMSPLSQVATLRAPDPRMITVQPWEATIIGDIERAIGSAGLGLNPSNDGVVIRVPIPALTGERRTELGKQAKRHGEDHKISLRNSRRDANDMIKELQKDGDISEDDEHKAYEKINSLTDSYSKKVEEILDAKVSQITEI